MVHFNRKRPVILALLALCAITLTAGQPAPPPIGPHVKPLQIKGDERKAERSDLIDEKWFPDGMSHDFGNVQAGIRGYHSFRIVNKSDVPLRIKVRPSAGSRSVRAWLSKDTLQPNEEGKVEIALDTRMFLGTKTVIIYVGSDNGKLAETRLWLQARILENLAFFPERIEFGKITRGDSPTRRMIVAVPGQPKLQVTGATCDNKFIQVKVQELARGGTTAIYQVSATVQGGTPVGKLHIEVELSTNNPAMPKLLVPISVDVEASK